MAVTFVTIRKRLKKDIVCKCENVVKPKLPSKKNIAACPLDRPDQALVPVKVKPVCSNRT